MAEKTAKTPTKSSAPAKVFDVAKPAKQVPAAATSRPVIVTNRPIMQDPMMLSNETVAESASRTGGLPAGKVVIKPLSEAEKTPDEKKVEIKPAAKRTESKAAAKKSDNPLADLPVIKLDDEIPVKVSAQSVPKVPVAQTAEPAEDKTAIKVAVKPVAGATAPAGGAGLPVGQAPIKATDSPAEVVSDAPKPVRVNTSEESPATEPAAASGAGSAPVEPQETPADQTSQADAAPTETESASADAEASVSPTDDIAASVDLSKGDEKASAELEASAKQQAVLDELVENKTYFLPINSVEKRRNKIVAVLGVFLIVVLGLLLIDLLMDVGAVKIAGIDPPLKYFSK
jgi:hypothetical protein